MYSSPMNLTMAQRESVRSIADGDADEVSKYHIGILRNKGLVHSDSRELTPKGREAYEEIMKSGDGPEALKEMFRI